MRPPENLFVKLYQPEADSVKWRFLFNFLGVESWPLRNEKELTSALLNDGAGLVIFDRNLLHSVISAIGPLCSQWIERGGGVALTGEPGSSPLPLPFLAGVADITERDPFTINALLQRFVPTYSRRYPRLDTRLPGLYSCASGPSRICEIINLSLGGAYLRTVDVLPAPGEELQLIVPLFGLHKEIELSCCVVSQALPHEANNYDQGIGVRFIVDEDSAAFVELSNFVRYVLDHDGSLDPGSFLFSDSRSKKIGHDVKSLPLRSEKRPAGRLLRNSGDITP